MNAHSAISAYTPTIYAEGSYQMTLEDFSKVHGIKTDALSGRQWAYGRNLEGWMVSAPLNVPLCVGCDKPIVDHLCPDCETVFLEEQAA
jgi:hypothetical protein